jgi:hypothetical protein
MGRVRRLVLSLGAAVSVVATAMMVTVGAAGGFGAGPGSFAYTDTSANANFFNPVDQSSVSVSVDRTLYLVNPGGHGGAEQMTVLSIFVFAPDPDPSQPPIVDASGCFVIPDSAFVVSKDLGKATLNATVNESDMCPGFLVPVGTDSTPSKGGGPGGGGFTFPLTVTGSWTGSGVIGKSDSQGVFRCGRFVSTTHSSSRSQFSAGMTVSISGFGTFSGSAPDAFGSVSTSDNRFDVNGTGVISPACGGKGG